MLGFLRDLFWTGVILVGLAVLGIGLLVLPVVLFIGGIGAIAYLVFAAIHADRLIEQEKNTTLIKK